MYRNGFQLDINTDNPRSSQIGKFMEATNHSTVDPSAPTILRPGFDPQATISTLFLLKFELWWEKDINIFLIDADKAKEVS